MEGSAVFSHCSLTLSVLCSLVSHETNKQLFLFLLFFIIFFLKIHLQFLLLVTFHDGLNPLKSSWVQTSVWVYISVPLNFIKLIFVQSFYRIQEAPGRFPDGRHEGDVIVCLFVCLFVFFCGVVWPQVFFFLPSLQQRVKDFFGKW